METQKREMFKYHALCVVVGLVINVILFGSMLVAQITQIWALAYAGVIGTLMLVAFLEKVMHWAGKKLNITIP